MFPQILPCLFKFPSNSSLIIVFPLNSSNDKSSMTDRNHSQRISSSKFLPHYAVLYHRKVFMYKNIRHFFKSYTKIYREGLWFQKISGGRILIFRRNIYPCQMIPTIPKKYIKLIFHTFWPFIWPLRPSLTFFNFFEVLEV